MPIRLRCMMDLHGVELSRFAASARRTSATRKAPASEISTKVVDNRVPQHLVNTAPRHDVAAQEQP